MVSVNLSPASRLSVFTFPRTSLVSFLSCYLTTWFLLKVSWEKVMGSELAGHKEHEEEHLGLAEIIVKCLSYAFKKQMF